MKIPTRTLLLFLAALALLAVALVHELDAGEPAGARIVFRYDPRFRMMPHGNPEAVRDAIEFTAAHASEFLFSHELAISVAHDSTKRRSVVLVSWPALRRNGSNPARRAWDRFRGSPDSFLDSV